MLGAFAPGWFAVSAVCPWLRGFMADCQASVQSPLGALPCGEGMVFPDALLPDQVLKDNDHLKCVHFGWEGAAGFSELLLYNMILDWKLSRVFLPPVFLPSFGHRSIVESVQLSRVQENLNCF